MIKQVTELLERPFKPESIKKRQGGFGKTLLYVEGHDVVRRLNRAFNYNWSFKIITPIAEAFVKDHVIVIGEIQCPEIVGVDDNGNFVLGPNWITRQQVGGKKVTFNKKDNSFLDLSSDYKAAVTDCIKKVASTLGVGLDLYGDDTEADDVIEAPSAASVASKKEEARAATEASDKAVEDGPASLGQKTAIENLAKKTGKDLNAVYNTLKIDGTKLTVSQAGAVITHLQSK